MANGKHRKDTPSHHHDRRNSQQGEYAAPRESRPQRTQAVPSEMVPVYPKTPGQQRLVDSVRQNPITIVMGGSGTGKAQALDELVLTPQGMVRIDSLRVGDLVRSATLGIDVAVVGVFPQGVTRASCVHFADGTSVVTNPEHLWTVRDQNKKANDGIVTVTTEEISQGILRGNSKHSHRYSVLAYTPKIQGNISPWAYFEGVMLGNGYFDASMLQISTSRRDYRELVATLAPLISPSNIYFPEGSNTVQLNFSWKDLPEHLLKYKHCEQLSGTKEIKNNWYLWDYQSQIDLLAGLYDSDGGAKDKRIRLRFTSTSKELIELFKNLVRHTGGRACEETLDTRVRKYTDGYCASVAFRHPVIFSRLKAKTFVRGNRQCSMANAIVAVTLEAAQETVCISINAEDGLYVTTGYKTTHNTMLCLYEALMMQKKQGIREILYSKPLVDFPSLQGIGFLPGEAETKLEPLLWPVKDNLKVFCGEGAADYLLRKKKIEPILLQDLRGRSLNDTFLLADECQNATPQVIEMILTRIGERSKVVIAGDYAQKDSKEKFTDGLSDAVNRLQGIPEVGIVRMDWEDCVRGGGLPGIIQQRYRD